MVIDNILLDLDGVVVDFVRGACAAHGYDYDRIDWDACGFDMHTGMGLTKAEFWAAIDADPGFWSNLEPLPWKDTLVEGLLGLGVPVTVCTTPSVDPACVAGKVEWIYRHLPEELHRRFVLTQHKDLLARPGTLLIDDADHNVEPFVAAGGQGLLFPAPWNSGPDVPPDLWITASLSILHIYT